MSHPEFNPTMIAIDDAIPKGFNFSQLDISSGVSPPKTKERDIGSLFFMMKITK